MKFRSIHVTIISERVDAYMFRKIINTYKSMDIKVHSILKHGLKFCSILCIISVILLFTYDILFSSPLMYHIGISLFRLSLIFAIEFFICAFAIDGIKRQVS